MWKILRWFFFLFDAERVHRWSVMFIRTGILFGNLPLRIVSGGGIRSSTSARPNAASELALVFGIPFVSRVGLAAGFDKNAEILAGLPSFGFGFAEIGTV